MSEETESVYDRVKRMVYPRREKPEDKLEKLNSQLKQLNAEIKATKADITFITNLSSEQLEQLSPRVRQWLIEKYPQYGED